MAFVLRRPVAIVARVTQFHSASAFSGVATRPFHRLASKQLQVSLPRPSLTSSDRIQQDAFRSAFRRQYNQQAPAADVDRSNLTRRLLYGAGLFGGTIFAINMVFNRETRDDGGMPPFEREYLNETFMHTGLGLGTIAIAARALHSSGWSYRIMATNPWLFIGVGLAASIGTCIGTRMIAPEK